MLTIAGGIILAWLLIKQTQFVLRMALFAGMAAGAVAFYFGVIA